MSTFSSVVNKSGKKFAPKATPRRNVQRSAPQKPSGQSQPEVPTVTKAIAIAVTEPGEIPPSNAEALPTPPSTSTTNSTPTPAPGRTTRSASLETARRSFSLASENDRPDAVAQIESHGKNVSWTDNETAIAPAREQDISGGLNETAIPPPVVSTARQGAKRKQAGTDTGARDSNLTSISSSNAGSVAVSSLQKRRRTTSQSATPTTSIQTTATPIIVTVSQSPSRSIQSRTALAGMPPTDTLLQNATSQAATVSALAVAIGGDPASARRRSEKRKSTDPSTATITESEDDMRLSTPRRSKRAKSRHSAIQDVAAEIVAEAVGESVTSTARKARRRTPDGAEEHQIEPTEVRMGDLVKDAGLGKKSQREAAMQQVDWDEVKKRRREEVLEAKRRRDAHEKEKTISTREHNETLAVNVHAEMEIVDGQIRVVDSTREKDRQAEALQRAADEGQIVIVENDVTKRVNQLTVGRQKGVGRGMRWDEEMEERFYRGLRLFGTDFMMISSLFPGMSRRHVKLKYVKEEKANWSRVQQNLAAREQVVLSEMQEITNKVYEDPKKVQEQIEAEEKRLREEDEARRAREDGEPHPDEETAETVLQSLEQGSAEPEARASEREETVAIERDESTNENRFSSIARGIVRDAAAPKKKRKQTAPAKKKDATKKGKRPMEGVEERLGPIDEVTR